MAKYEKYAEYKDSGIEWLGEIPNHWAMSKLRYLFDFSKGLSITKENLQDEGIPCVNYGEVHSRYGFEVNPKKHPLKYVSENYLKTSENALLNIGDFIFADTSEDLKGSGNFTHLVGDERIFAGYHTVIARPHNANSSRFYAYLFDSKEFRSQIQLAVKGVKVFSITQAMLRSADAWLPSPDEQVKIANFLDHETAKIDSLIAKQEKLIELLKEKRQAVISHAVTKGLNPDVAMKDSGVEWLGQVPEHWSITSVRSLIRSGNLFLQDGNHGELHPTANDYVEEGIPFLMANNVRNGKLLMDDVKRIPKSIADKLRIGFAKQGDMLLTHKGTVGEVALVPLEIAEEYWMLTPQVTYYRWNSQKFLNQYFCYQFQSVSIQNQLEIIGGKQSTRAYVGLIAQGDLIVVIPPIEEQIKIAKSIFEKDQSYQQMILKAESAIELMQERRTALISSAVTGKIDVRNWQHPNKNNDAKTELGV